MILYDKKWIDRVEAAEAVGMTETKRTPLEEQAHNILGESLSLIRTAQYWYNVAHAEGEELEKLKATPRKTKYDSLIKLEYR